MGITVSITLTIAILGAFVLFLHYRSSGSKKVMNDKNLETDKKMNTLDSKVREKFKLFTGLRPQEEDQKMYDKIMELCFDEMSRFLSDKLSEEQKNAMFDDLAKSQSDEDKEKVIANYFAKVEKAKSKFNARIDLFLNNLLMKSMKAVQN